MGLEKKLSQAQVSQVSTGELGQKANGLSG
jgi:hypothetical protein